MASSALAKGGSVQPLAAVLTIGDELLTGRTVNTNAAFLGKELTRLGFRVICQYACRDQIAAIQDSLRSLEFADAVIVTGGLGPTPDDVTRQAIAQYFGSALEFSPAQFKAVAAVYRKLGRKMPRLSRQELFYPQVARPLVNRFGIALGFWVPRGEKALIALPGVPTELQKMFETQVGPFLARRFKKARPDGVVTVKLVGISEPIVMEKLKPDFFNDPFQFGIYPSEGEVQICIRSPDTRILKRVRAKINQRLKKWIYGWDDESLAEKIGNLLVKKRKTVSVAESCTGGSLSFAWTRHPGASRFFRGGAVVYDAKTKQRIGVNSKTIKEKGEVSAEVATELAVCAARFGSADFGVGITGIAGPTGGSRKKPLGLVFFAIAKGVTTIVEKKIFWGNRDQVQRKAVMHALELLWRELV